MFKYVWYKTFKICESATKCRLTVNWCHRFVFNNNFYMNLSKPYSSIPYVNCFFILLIEIISRFLSITFYINDREPFSSIFDVNCFFILFIEIIFKFLNMTFLGFNNYHIIAIHDDVRAPKFWRMGSTWANTKNHISGVIFLTSDFPNNFS